MSESINSILFYNGVLMINKKEYDREMRAEYDRGYQDGLSKHDTDAWQLEQERSEIADKLCAYEFPYAQTRDNLKILFYVLGIDSSLVYHGNAFNLLRDRLVYLFGGDTTCGKPQKPANRSAKTDPNLQDSPKTINKGDLVPKCTGLETLDQERAVAIQRLKEVPFDGLDSHHNLSAIANAVWGATPIAWTKESCMALARRLVWLLGAEDESEEPTANELRDAIAFGLSEAGLEDLSEKFDRLMQLVGGEDG